MQRKSKLQLWGDGSFQMNAWINDNAYKINLPSEYNVNATFNVYDLSPFDVGEDLWTNHSKERVNDGNQGSNYEEQQGSSNDPFAHSWWTSDKGQS